MILATPITTEKAYGLAAGMNTFVFSVPVSANKQQIAAAVETQYEVKVKNVTTVLQKGKAVRFSRGKNRYPGATTRQDMKKAYVTLAEGSTIPVFAEAQQEAK
jgi:large subunit ribosomal protein L23